MIGVRRRLLARPELLLLLGLVVGCAFLSRGLPLGIAGLGVVSGCLLGLHAMAIALLYARTRILSFAQFGLGAGAAVLYFAWVNWNQWAVLANGICGCLAPEGMSMGYLQHHPDQFREYLQAQHPWALVANAVISAAIALLFAMLSGLQVFIGIAVLFRRAPAIVPTVATLAFASSLAGAAEILTLRTKRPFGWHAFEWWPYAGIRSAGSARHVPDEFVAVPGLPHTLTGKRLEVPVKRLLLGHPVEQVVAASAVDRPELLDLFVGLAAG